MYIFLLSGKEYRVKFRHVTTLGKCRQLYPNRSPIKGVVATHEFICIDNAICDWEDNFSRREGRFRALKKVLKHNSCLKPVEFSLLAEMLKADPDPDPLKKRKIEISPEERSRRIEAGSTTREARKTAGAR